ncbi:barstar family protein [Pigmentiphaga sp.]|jgi:Barstar, RNAse (barnase) inhibitor|uniref:barstar family protein n=1 Tax=Pigmentiphaga sp. TaxID=1977564 RepID=UPI0025D7BCE9|nr:barstar family protein [Pigmentiphaga sp.]MBX6318029.1 barstar family protein [Pigmentiphaga sp.]
MSLNSRKLSECLKTGGALYDQGVDARMLKRAAQESNLALFEVDCSRAKSKSAVLRAIANTVDFPEHFGGNLDALYDCLCDTVLDQEVGMVLALRHVRQDDPGLAEHAAAIAQVGEDVVEFARENGKTFAFILERADSAAEPVGPSSAG